MAKLLIANKSSEKKTLEDIKLEDKFYEINPELLHPARFMILNSLFRYDALDFSVLKKVTHSKSDGSLFSHIRSLKKSNTIIDQKEESNGRVRTFYKLTKEGREEFRNLVKILKASLKEIEVSV